MEWISVDERLPETNAHHNESGWWVDADVQVLGYFQDSEDRWHVETITFCDNRGCELPHITEECTWYTHWGDVAEDVEPTHWIPLPEPPTDDDAV